jgi:NAD(P)-dependent dehydrogenase (short-subunit alcohol dehydrogenase family)
MEQKLAELPPLRLPEILKGQLENKVGIVTGASRGIGAAAVATFAIAGAKVVLAARNSSQLEATAHSIDPSGNDVLALSTDVADPASVERLIQSTIDKFGRLDFAFNNAGDGHMPSPLADVGIEDFDRAVRTNVRGTFLCMKYEIPVMLHGGGGAIVNMSSTAGLQGVKGISGYVAGKHAIIGLSQAAALDYARQNIRVNVVAPGPILTERLASIPNRDQVAMAVPMGRIGNREEVAQVVAWLCSDLSSFVTGVTIPVDGGRLAGVWF